MESGPSLCQHRLAVSTFGRSDESTPARAVRPQSACCTAGYPAGQLS